MTKYFFLNLFRIRTTHYTVRAIALCLFLLLLLFQPLSLLASGPGTGGSKIQLDNEPVGPYRLLVATSPLPMTVGPISVWVRVMDGEGKQAQRNAVVMVEATPPGGSEIVSQPATHQNAGNAIDYVAHFEVDRAGEWQMKVVVDDELGQAEVVFAETVTRSLDMGLILATAVPFVVLAVVAGVFLWRRSEQEEK